MEVFIIIALTFCSKNLVLLFFTCNYNFYSFK